MISLGNVMNEYKGIFSITMAFNKMKLKSHLASIVTIIYIYGPYKRRVS